MLLAENLMTLVVVILISIICWESGRSLIKRIFKKRLTYYKEQPVSTHRLILEKEKLLHDMKKEASTIMGQGHFAGMLMKDRILKEARHEANRILQEAKNEAEKVRSEGMSAFQKDMADMIQAINQEVKSNMMNYVRQSSKTTPKVINKYLENCYQHNNSRVTYGCK